MMKALVRLPFHPHPPVPLPFSGSMKSQPWTTREVPLLFIKRHKLLTVRMEQVQHCKVCRCQNDNKGRLWTAMGFPSKVCLQCRSCGFGPWIRKIPWRMAHNPLQYSWLENPMDRGAWWTIVHRVTESNTTEVTKYTRMQWATIHT